jgi:hypothetical protein
VRSVARELLGVEPIKPLKSVLGAGVYWAWGLLLLSLFAGVVFHFLSAKWVRIAWGQSAGLFGIPVSETFVERALEVSFWTTAASFLIGVLLTVLSFSTY